jgi:hypothetical protein
MGILTDQLSEVTDDILSNMRFSRIGWGAPKYAYTHSVNNNWRYKRRTRENGWGPEQMAWEYVDIHGNDAGIVGIINYYPPTFEGYVTNFAEAGILPAGHAAIYLDGDVVPYPFTKWYHIMDINNIGDLEMAKQIMIDKIKELQEAYSRPW